MWRRRLLPLVVGLSILTAVVLLTGRSGFRALVAYGVEWRFDAVEHLSVEAAATGVTDPAPPLFLDVRGRDEYLAGHIRGARWLDPATAAPTVVDALPSDRPIIAYCSVGWRSSEMAARLRAAGRPAVTNLRGGLFEWVVRGHPVVRDGRASRQVHPYGVPWSWLLPEALRADP